MIVLVMLIALNHRSDYTHQQRISLKRQ